MCSRNAGSEWQDLFERAATAFSEGDYDLTIQYAKAALAIAEKDGDPKQTNVCSSLNILASGLSSQGHYFEAEKLFSRAQKIGEDGWGPDSPFLSEILNKRAVALGEQGKLGEAEPLYRRALSIVEKNHGEDSFEAADILYNLRQNSLEKGRDGEAEQLCRREVAIREKQLGHNHPDIATILRELAWLYYRQAKYDEAEPHFYRSLTISEKNFGSDHIIVADILADLALLHIDQGKNDEAVLLSERALAIKEEKFGQSHEKVMGSVSFLAWAYFKQGRLDDAEDLNRRCLAIGEERLESNHPDLAECLEGLAFICNAQGKDNEADLLYMRANGIKNNNLNSDHTDEARSLITMANNLAVQGKYEEAEPLFRRALEVRENNPASGYPDLADCLDGLATTLTAHKKYDEAEPLFLRARAFCEKNFGKDNPRIGKIFDALGWLYFGKKQYPEAEQSYNRALEIFEQKLGPDHEDTKDTRESLALLADLTSPPQVQSGALPELDHVCSKLNRLIGLDAVKEEVADLLAFLKVEKMKRNSGMPANSLVLHTVFTGPPGTGKTTVARLMGEIFSALGVLEKGHTNEVNRGKLLADHIGGTEKKTGAALEEALDGVLFIDEAYGLAGDGNDFGPKAVELILDFMDKNKDRLCVIFAGYPDEIGKLMASNPGLTSRFSRTFEFADYKPDELMSLFELFAEEKKCHLTEKAKPKLLRYFKFAYSTRDASFGNARFVERVLENILKHHARRIVDLASRASTEEEQKELLSNLELEDIEAAVGGLFEDSEEQEELEDILAELNGLIGLDEVKQDCSDLMDFIQNTRNRIKVGLPAESISLHAVFAGPPGTGKTTVAKLLGKIYRKIGVLAKGKVHTIKREDLVGEAIGHTESRTNKIIDEALDGILFIDEAYSLVVDGRDFGKQAIETLLTRMDDQRDRLCVIVAGYPGEMKKFISSNPGLKSRFTNTITFKDYEPQELLAIFQFFLNQGMFVATEDALRLVEDHLTVAHATRSHGFGNGRDVRNIYEGICKAQATRVVRLGTDLDRKTLQTITDEDVSRYFERIQEN